MKKTIAILCMLFAFTAMQAQTKTKVFTQVGVSAGVDRVINESVEFGAEANKNRVSVIGQSFNDSVDNRKYLVGVKYLRLFNLLPNLYGTVSLAGKTRVDNTALYVVEPGVGINFDLGRGIALVTCLTSPITQTSFSTRTTTFAGNASLKFNLN